MISSIWAASFLKTMVEGRCSEDSQDLLVCTAQLSLFLNGAAKPTIKTIETVSLHSTKDE